MICLSSLVLLLTVLCFLSTVKADSVDNDKEYCTVETEYGRTRGKQNRTLFENKLFYSFRGIPFAKPPINNLRFKVKWSK